MLDDVLLSRRCEIRLDRIIRRLSAECHHDPRGDALLDEQISPSSGGGRDSRRAGSRDLPFPHLLSRPRARPALDRSLLPVEERLVAIKTALLYEPIHEDSEIAG